MASTRSSTPARKPPASSWPRSYPARTSSRRSTIWFEHLKTLGKKDAPVDQRRAIFVSGDDTEAKGAVSRLIEDIGFGPYDMGSLHDSTQQQPDTAVYNRDVTVAEASEIAPRA
jgi:predicted dinucleotide-binding enzyme